MIIISDFRDYYDCCQKDDQDKITKFLRNRGEETSHKDLRTAEFDIVVGFAGKLYPGVRFPVIDGKPIKAIGWYDNFKIYNRYLNSGCISEYFYDEFTLQDLNDVTKKSYGWMRSGTDPLTAIRSPKLAELLTERFGPIFTIRPGAFYHSLVIVNDRLNQYNFQRALSPQLAYQELTRWVYNHASPEKPIPQMSNEMKIHQHGFNNKTSFRKEKEKK